MLFVAMVKPVGKYRHQMPAVFHSRLRLKIGLVGGSFNPAHDGHIHVALKARQQLGLDQIWWLVSPQNPLKSSLGMASHEKRLANARKLVAAYPFLRVIKRRIWSGFNSVCVLVMCTSYQNIQAS